MEQHYEQECAAWRRNYGHLARLKGDSTLEDSIRRWREWYEGKLVDALKTMPPGYSVARSAPSQQVKDPRFTIRRDREPVAYVFPLRQVEQTWLERILPWMHPSYEALVRKEEVELFESLRKTKLHMRLRTIDDFVSLTDALEGRFDDLLENNP